jgi:hypothetical protein
MENKASSVGRQSPIRNRVEAMYVDKKIYEFFVRPFNFWNIALSLLQNKMNANINNYNKSRSCKILRLYL